MGSQKHVAYAMIKPMTLRRINELLSLPHGPDIVEECGYCKDNLLWDFTADFDASTTAGIIVATDDVSFYCYVILLDDNACEAGVINDVSKLEYGQTFQFSLNGELYEVVVERED